MGVHDVHLAPAQPDEARRLERLEDAADHLVDTIADQPMVLTFSHKGYVKRTHLGEYRSQGRGGTGIRLMEGRFFKPGLEEVVVGRRIRDRVRGLELGATLRGRQASPFRYLELAG